MPPVVVCGSLEMPVAPGSCFLSLCLMSFIVCVECTSSCVSTVKYVANALCGWGTGRVELGAVPSSSLSFDVIPWQHCRCKQRKGLTCLGSRAGFILSI